MSDNSSCCKVKKIGSVCSTLAADTPFNAARLSVELEKRAQLQAAVLYYKYTEGDITTDVWHTNINNYTYVVSPDGKLITTTTGGVETPEKGITCLNVQGTTQIYYAIDWYAIASIAARNRCWLNALPNVCNQPYGNDCSQPSECVCHVCTNANDPVQRCSEMSIGPVLINPWGIAVNALTAAAGQRALGMGGGSAAPAPPPPPPTCGERHGTTLCYTNANAIFLWPKAGDTAKVRTTGICDGSTINEEQDFAGVWIPAGKLSIKACRYKSKGQVHYDVLDQLILTKTEVGVSGPFPCTFNAIATPDVNIYLDTDNHWKIDLSVTCSGSGASYDACDDHSGSITCTLESSAKTATETYYLSDMTTRSCD